MKSSGGRHALVTVVVIGFLLAGSFAAGAEEAEADGRITLGTGMESLASRDQMGSPFLYRGGGHPVWVAAHRQGGHWRWGMDWRGSVSGWNAAWMEAAISDGKRHRAEAVSVEGSLYLQGLVASEGGHQLFLGGELSNWTFFRSYHYDEHQIGAVEIWEAPVVLNARAEMVRRLGAWELSVAALVPVGGRMLRPNYAIRGDERIEMVERRLQILRYGSWASWNRLQMLRGIAGMGWRRERLGLRLEASAGWLRYQGDWETRAGRVQALFGAEIHF